MSSKEDISRLQNHTHSILHDPKSSFLHLPSVCAGSCISEGTDDGTGDTLDTVHASCFVPAVFTQG